MVYTVAIENKSSHEFDVPGLITAASWYLTDITRHWGGVVWDVVDALHAQDFTLTVVDTLDQAGALGYHDVGPTGKPYALVSVQESLAGGVDLDTVITHELAELVGDPLCSQWVQAPNGLFYAQEFADAVESDYYQVDGHNVSNWLYPSYFNPFGKPPFDSMGLLPAPFSIRPTGYIIVSDGATVKQLFGDAVPEARRQAKATRLPVERAYKRGVRA